jgi:hypothetical protein
VLQTVEQARLRVARRRLPASISARSAIVSMLPSSCVTTTQPMPSSRSDRMRSSMPRAVTGSRPADGSSTRSSAGSSASARAMPARLRMPPDSSDGMSGAARVDAHAAGERLEQRDDRAQERALPAAARAEDDEDLAALEPQADAVEHRAVAVTDDQVLDLEERGSVGGRRHPTSVIRPGRRGW